MFAAGSPWRQRLEQARCYLRYAVAPLAEERHSAAKALTNWLHSQRSAVSQIFERPSDSEPATEAERAVDRVSRAHEHEKVFPAGF